MKKRLSSYEETLLILKQLKRDYPTHNMGRHLSLALGDYGDLWAVTDREILFALTKYQNELELDKDEIADGTYVEKIVKEAMDFEHILDEPDEDEDYGN